MPWTTADYKNLVAALRRLDEAIDKALQALLRGDADDASRCIERAISHKYFAVKWMPEIIVNGHETIPFHEVYNDFYDIDLLWLVARSWPDPRPTDITNIDELIAGLDEKLEKLRALRARQWMEEDSEALDNLDRLISRLEKLIAALRALPKGAKLDTTKLEWNAQFLKWDFLDGVGDPDRLGLMYAHFFTIDLQLADAKWLIANGQLTLASAHLEEAERSKHEFLEWLEHNRPEPSQEETGPGGEELRPLPEGAV